jgi:hypothetical protein
MIARRLTEEIGGWVAMTELWRCSGSMNIHSRISDLRKEGMVIENHKKREGRQIHSSYRLVGVS